MEFSKLFRQRRVKRSRLSMVIGGFQQTYAQLSVYISMVNFIMLLAVFYNTVVVETPWLSWMGSPAIFITILFVGGLVAGTLIWHIVIPHVAAYGNYIAYTHGSFLREDHEELNKRINTLEEKLDKALLKENK